MFSIIYNVLCSLVIKESPLYVRVSPKVLKVRSFGTLAGNAHSKQIVVLA